MNDTAPILFVVEDEPVTAELVQIYFEDLGFQVFVAHSGRVARELGERRRPDALITDLLLEGGESGLDVARHYRERYPALPILLISGFPNSELEAASTMIEHLEVFPKPVRLATLRAALESLMEGSEVSGSR